MLHPLKALRVEMVGGPKDGRIILLPLDLVELHTNYGVYYIHRITPHHPKWGVIDAVATTSLTPPS